MPTHQLQNGEFHCEWTCPVCGSRQNSSVHMNHGPWVSCECCNCETTFYDEHLDSISLASWDEARNAAEDAGKLARQYHKAKKE